MTATLTFNGPDADFFDNAFFATDGSLALAPNSPTTPSSSFEVVNTENGATTTFGGTGIGLDGNGDPVGTINTITFVQAGGTVATVTGISWLFSELLFALEEDGDFGNEAPLLALFSAQDWTMSGAGATGPVDLYLGGVTTSIDLTGTPFGDTLSGGDNDDTIDPLGAGGAGFTDVIFGSLGNDTIDFSTTDGQFISLDYQDLAGPITFNINDVTNTGTVTDGAFTDTLINVSTVMDWNKDGIQFVGSWENDTFNVVGDTESWAGLVGLGGNDVFNIDTAGIVRIDYRNPFASAVDVNLLSGLALDGLGGTDTISIASDMTGQTEVRGTSFADTFTGSSLDDRYIAFGGDDTVDGQAGFDMIRYDRSGVDAVEVNLLFNEAFGTWNGVGFTNTLISIEAVRGSRNGNDTIAGDLEDNFFNGYGGDDLFFAGGGDNTIDGGDGTDTVYVGYSSTQMAVSTASGDVQLTLGGTNTFFGVEQFEFLDQTLSLAQVQALAGQLATSGSIEYFGGDQNFFENAFFDGAGVISVSATGISSTQFTAVNSVTGAETIFTGSGFVFDLSNDPVDGFITGIQFTQGGSTVAEISGLTWSLIDFVDALDEIEFNGSENILATLLSLQDFSADASTATDGASLIFDDVVSTVSVTGSGFDDELAGGTGNDSLSGEGGNDTLSDGEGNDTVLAGAGDDEIIAGTGNDVFNGGGGNDTLILNLDPNALPPGLVVETNLVTGYNGVFGAGAGSPGSDTLVSIENVLFTGAGADISLTGNGEANRLQGAEGNDTIIGAGGNDTILSGNNDDSISGGDGNDILNAGGGLDFLEGGAGADVLVGGNGRDTAVYSNETVGIAINMATGSFAGGEAAGDSFNGIEDIFGGSGDDTLTGDSGSNLLLGDVGNDSLDGGTGAQRDVLLGGAQNDTLLGNDGNDILNGGGGNDRLTGGAGIDVLVGGRGNDIFTGGADRDIFVFQQGAWNTGVITDWGDGADRVRIVSNFGAGDVTLTQQGADVLFTMTPTGDTILFQNTLVADLDLNSTDFIFI